MRLYYTLKRGGKTGLQAFPDPPSGKSYLVVPLDTNLVNKIGALDAQGYWERELSEMLEREIAHFFQTRPISISTPAPKLETMKLYDPRDPERERIN